MKYDLLVKIRLFYLLVACVLLQMLLFCS